MSWWGDGGGRKQLLERIAALEKTAEDQKSGFRVLRLEWEDVYDRVTRAMSRLNARARKNAEGEAPETTQPSKQEQQQQGGTHAILQAARSRRG